MAKICRVLNLNQNFSIGLFIGIFFILILFLWRQQIFHHKSTYFLSNFPAFEGKITNGTRALIVDLKCLKKLAASQNCDFPIIVAIPLGHKFDEEYFMRSQFYLEDLAERNFWLFHNATNSTQKIATKKFKTRRAILRLEGNKLTELDVPIGMDKFARHWRNGQFIDCQPLILRRPTNMKRLIPLKYLDRVSKFAELLEKFNAMAFIFGGTLLGWRRECSLIPHTNDIDLAIFSEDHSDALLRAILTSPTFIIHWVLGRLRDSFELSVNVDGFKIDLFYIYRNNNSTFIGGMRPEKRQRILWRYPKIDGDICAGELHGRLVNVLCEHQQMIEAEYGKEKWKNDIDIDTNSLAWDKGQNKESKEIYTTEEWPNVFLRVENKTERFDPALVDKWMKNIKKSE